MDERKGVPWISRMTWFWAVIYTLFSCGLFGFAMGLYISFWVRQKRGKGLAFWGYAIIVLGLAASYLPVAPIANATLTGHLSTILSLALGIAWFGNIFVLRHELMNYYASPEGGVLEISPLWTTIFNIYYLNYCLWVVRDSA